MKSPTSAEATRKMRTAVELLERFAANPWAVSFTSLAAAAAVIGWDRLPFA